MGAGLGAEQLTHRRKSLCAARTRLVFGPDSRPGQLLLAKTLLTARMSSAANLEQM
jgi:hypothetical protein